MKKWIAMLFVMALCLSLAACGGETAGAEPAVETPAEDQTMVTVTISDAGTLAVAAETVAVTDLDGDGALTITDALAAAHAAFHPQGAEGYATMETDYGLSMQMLWGVENGGSYGYYVNNASAFNLTDPVVDGDYVAAYSYADLAAWSDTYTWFDDLVVTPGEVTLTLSAASFDADWNPVTLPVNLAKILINGEATEYYTNEQGEVTFTAEAGDVISAEVEGMVIVPPVCVVAAQ